MTVSRAFLSVLVLALVVAAGPRAARAEGAAFVHDATIYNDAKDVPLRAPEGVGCNDAGHLVVADTGNGRLVTFSYKEGRLGGGEELKLTQLTEPLRVQVTSKGDLLVLDGKTRKIVRVGPNGAFAGTLEPKIEDAGAVVPVAFKLDGSDNVYLLDAAGRRVLVMDTAGAVARVLPLPKEAGVVMDVAADSGGTIYAVDAVGAAVWTAEKGAKEFKPLVQGLKDRMSFPTYVVVSKGRIFLVDQNGSGIVVLGMDGSYQGRQLSIGWSDGLVNYPAQLCMTDGGLAFLADRFNNRVQVFTTGK